MSVDAFFLPAAAGSRFCILHTPESRVEQRGGVVFVPPFAEEMNKSRRMAAIQARAMAAEGYVVLQIDLLGCGDSSGDFGDASWEDWVADILLASRWMRQQTSGPLWLWGLRAGCLLACDVANRLDLATNLLLWQPIASGKQCLTQFLRLKLAGDMQEGANKSVTKVLREQLAKGVSVEVAGYTISPAMASGLEHAELSLSPQVNRVEWLELTSKDDGVLSPIAQSVLAGWAVVGQAACRGTGVRGVAFWQTTETSESQELISATLRVLGSVEDV